MLVIFLGIFAAAFIFSAYFQFSPQMPLYSGEDSFYHVGMAKFISENGIVQKFPWLYYTELHQKFVDHHLLFHLLLIPFVKIFGDNIGPKVLTILFFALSFAILYLIFKKEKVGLAAGVTLFLLFVMPCDFYFRMQFIRAQSGALFLMILAFYFISQRKTLFLFILAFCFAWFYGGSLFILFILLSFFLAQLLTKEPVNKKILLAGLGGWIAGCIINPYFPRNFHFLYAQVFQTGLGAKPYSGGEWYPYDAWYFTKISLLPLLLFFSGIIAALSQRPRLNSHILALFLFSLILLFFQLKSRRFVEYWPFFAAAAGILLLREPLQKIVQKPPSYAWLILVIPLVFALGYGFDQVAHGFKDTYTPINVQNTQEVHQYLFQHSTPGEIVFTDDWDVFPFYFFFNRKNYYIVGLDPEFMNQYNSSLYSEYADISSGKDASRLERIKNDFRAGWVLVARDHPQFKKNLENKPETFVKVFANNDYTLFQVK